MSNQTLRERFKIDEKNSAIASRIIRDTIEAKLIKEEDPSSKSKIRKLCTILGLVFI